jgi:hypothetical protein
MAQELPTQTGGKKSLITFFEYLRKRKMLVNNFKGKTWGVIFFLDKE